MPRTYLVIPTASQIAQILVGAHNATQQLPPDGMSLGIDPTADWLDAADGYFQTHSPLYVAGDPPEGTEQDWYWGTVGDLVTDALIGDHDSQQWLLEKIAQLTSTTLSGVLSVPLLKKGTANTTMRWLRVTYAGTLGGVETFQHKVDLGHSGDDPDINEAEAAALAEAIATSWKTAFEEYPQNVHNPEIVYTEVGVAKITQTDSSDAEGEGGNPTYDYGTQWFAWDLGDQPVGVATTASLPYEVACAVTLQTNHRGASGRGRFYLPPFSASAMGAVGRFNTSALTNIGTALGHHFDDIRADNDFYPVVVSGRRLILNEIVAMQIGAVPDSQRRRRKSQDEARATVWTA